MRTVDDDALILGIDLGLPDETDVTARAAMAPAITRAMQVKTNRLKSLRLKIRFNMSNQILLSLKKVSHPNEYIKRHSLLLFMVAFFAMNNECRRPWGGQYPVVKNMPFLGSYGLGRKGVRLGKHPISNILLPGRNV